VDKRTLDRDLNKDFRDFKRLVALEVVESISNPVAGKSEAIQQHAYSTYHR
jgi:hypothetical protein